MTLSYSAPDRGQELRAGLQEVEKSRLENKKLSEELRLLKKRSAYLESELETYKLKVALLLVSAVL